MIARQPFPRRLASALVLFALLLVVAGQGSAAQRAYLRASILVDGDSVRLGDVFEGVTENIEKIIAYAPPPGRKLILEAYWLQRVARAYGVPWRPATRRDRAIVERRSQIVGAREIAAAILEAIRADFGDTAGKQGGATDTDLEIALDNRSVRIFLPIEMPATATVQSLSYDPRSGSFSARLIAPDDRPGAVRAVVTGRAHKLVRTPTLARRISAGQIIRERDIEWKMLRAGRLGRGAFRELDNLIGMSARRPIVAGRPIYARDVQPPVLVVRGKPVTIYLRTAFMQLTTRGRALENGGVGDVVRVRNVKSGKTIDATVIGPERVVVSMDGKLALR